MKNTKEKQLLDILEQKPIMPLFYEDDINEAKHLVEECYQGGIRVIEFVNRGPNALPVFKELLKMKESYPDLLLGVGTIKTKKQAKQFVKAGTDFVVTPFLSKKVGKVCIKNNVPWIPGCSTLTEMYTAHTFGASMVKAFPVSTLGGTKFIKNVLAPCPELKIMPSGGIQSTPEEINAYKDAGVYAIGLGSSLFKDKKNIKNLCKQLLMA